MNYEDEVQFWQKLCHQVLTDNFQALEWNENWLNKNYADGTPMQDGNPIFDLINRSHRRAVRIIQNSPDEASVDEYTLWMNKTFINDSEHDEEVEEMVFVCNGYKDKFPEHSARFFAGFFKIWSNPQVDYEEMERIIATHVEN